MPAAQSNQVATFTRVPVVAGPEQSAKARVLATVALVYSIRNLYHLPEVLPVGLPAAVVPVEILGAEREGAEVAVTLKTEDRLLQEALQVSLIRAAAAVAAGILVTGRAAQAVLES